MTSINTISSYTTKSALPSKYKRSSDSLLCIIIHSLTWEELLTGIYILFAEYHPGVN
jgi:hypothetical protein